MRIPVYNDGYTPDLENFARRQRYAKPRRMAVRQEKPTLIGGIKRPLGEQDTIRIGSIVGKLLEDLELPPEGRMQIFSDPGVSLLSPSTSALMFAQKGGYGKSKPSLRKHNNIVERNRKKFNRMHPMLFAQLGEVRIFGAQQGDDDSRKRYIGPEIKADSIPELAIESDTLYHSLMPHASETDYQAFSQINSHHISLVGVQGQANAEHILSVLGAGALEGMWVTLLPGITRHRTIETSPGQQ